MRGVAFLKSSVGFSSGIAVILSFFSLSGGTSVPHPTIMKKNNKNDSDFILCSIIFLKESDYTRNYNLDLNLD